MSGRPPIAGPLLRTGLLRDFNALGSVGSPVFATAAQMRSTIRRQLGEPMSLTLAIPQINERGDTMDWYAERGSVVVPWSSATFEERAGALKLLKARRQALIEHSALLLNRLETQDSGVMAGKDLEVFARLLPFGLQIPDDSHIYLVDDQPVVTFWGFTHIDAFPTGDTIRDLVVTPPASLSAPSPAASSPILREPPGAAPDPRFRWWRPWFLWLFPFLLLLLSLFLLRVCALPESLLKTDLWGRSTPLNLPQPELSQIDKGNIPSLTQPGTSNPEPLNMGKAKPLPPLESPRPEPPKTEKPPIAPKSEPPEPTPKTEEPPIVPKSEPPEPTLPGRAEEKAPAFKPLALPPEALATGNPDFMNGRWRSRTGLINDRGLPVEVEYVFQNGKGTASIRQADGVICSAPSQVRLEGGALHIEHLDDAACPDGSQFNKVRIDCTPDAGGRARCEGVNAGDGSRFDVLMGQ